MGNRMSMSCTSSNALRVKTNNKKYIVIQGNIGAGKSTLFNEVKTRFSGNPRICMLPEPVDTWMDIKDKSGTILEHYYSDQKKYAFTFQMMAYISRLSILREAMKGDYDIIISERSLETDRNVFAAMLYDTEMIGDIEYQIYKKWFDEFTSDFPKETTIYVKTDPDVAHKRVIGRNRDGETIPIEYLEMCHKYHEKWLVSQDNTDVVILDGNMDIKSNKDIMNIWIMRVFEACFS
uniref:Deoxynucleoside kinase domain-containing protein n=1 Tax=viral metagenome TaxID=1070528 RepID=A0A6C0BQJ5_9ZZZZ